MHTPLHLRPWLAAALATLCLCAGAQGASDTEDSKVLQEEADAATRQVLTLFVESFPPLQTTTCLPEPYPRSASALLAWLHRNPAGWEVLMDPIEQRFGQLAAQPESNREAQLALLDFLVEGPLDRVEALVAELWCAAPTSFDPEHVLAMAEKGSPLFWNELRQRVLCGATNDSRPAALMAFAGDERGRPALLGQLASIRQELAPGPRSFRTPRSSPGSLAEALFAAAALRTLGSEEAWPEVRHVAREAVLKALTSGALERAKELALETEYVTLALREPGPPGLSRLARRVQAHIEIRLAAIVTIDDVLGLIEVVAHP